MSTSGPRSVRQQKKAISKRSFDEDQTADMTCKCLVGKKTLCQYCKKSPKKFKLQKGEIFRLLCIALSNYYNIEIECNSK